MFIMLWRRLSAAYFLKCLLRILSERSNLLNFLKGRGQIVRLGKGWLVNDTYNANPVSMRAALQTLQAIETKGQRIFVAANMLELGSQAESFAPGHGRPLGSGYCRG